MMVDLHLRKSDKVAGAIKMELNSVLKRAENLVHETVDGELVMMNVHTGLYLSLNETGVIIWELLDEPRSISSILEVLQDKFHVTPEQCKTDVLPFLQKLLDRNILVSVT